MTAISSRFNCGRWLIVDVTLLLLLLINQVVARVSDNSLDISDYYGSDSTILAKCGPPPTIQGARIVARRISGGSLRKPIGLLYDWVRYECDPGLVLVPKDGAVVVCRNRKVPDSLSSTAAAATFVNASDVSGVTTTTAVRLAVWAFSPTLTDAGISNLPVCITPKENEESTEVDVEDDDEKEEELQQHLVVQENSTNSTISDSSTTEEPTRNSTELTGINGSSFMISLYPDYDNRTKPVAANPGVRIRSKVSRKNRVTNPPNNNDLDEADSPFNDDKTSNRANRALGAVHAPKQAPSGVGASPQPTTCGLPPDIPNTYVVSERIADGFRVGSPYDWVRYGCVEGFRLVGSDIVVCLLTGQWMNAKESLPFCEVDTSFSATTNGPTTTAMPGSGESVMPPSARSTARYDFQHQPFFPHYPEDFDSHADDEWWHHVPPPYEGPPPPPHHHLPPPLWQNHHHDRSDREFDFPEALDHFFHHHHHLPTMPPPPQPSPPPPPPPPPKVIRVPVPVHHHHEHRGDHRPHKNVDVVLARLFGLIDEWTQTGQKPAFSVQPLPQHETPAIVNSMPFIPFTVTPRARSTRPYYPAITRVPPVIPTSRSLTGWNWNPSGKAMKLLTCGPPPPIPDSSIIASSLKSADDYGYPRDWVQYECANKFELYSSDTVICMPDGRWMNEYGTLPLCLAPGDCPPPPEIPLATVDYTSLIPGSTAIYYCSDEKDYAMVGHTNIITCLRNATWTTPEFECLLNSLPKSCDKPPLIRYGRITKESRYDTFGWSVAYVCDNVAGARYIRCHPYRGWGKPPVCPPPPKPEQQN